MKKRRWIAFLGITLVVGVAAYSAWPQSATRQTPAPLVVTVGPGQVVDKLSREDLLRIAFGASAVETTRPIRLLIRDKGLVLAAGQFFLEDDGRVKLAEVSAALFPTNVEVPKEPLTTVRSKWVIITFDQPLRSAELLSSRRWVSLEFPSGVIYADPPKKTVQP
jgi:hypothetical protein